MKLISSAEEVRRQFGFNPMSDLLVPTVHLDDPTMTTPLMASVGDDVLLLAREVELGNLRALGVNSKAIRLIDPYVTLDNMIHGFSSYPSLADAVEDLSDGRLTVGSDLAFGRYLQLRDRVEVDIDIESAEDRQAPVVAYQLPRKAVLDRFAWLRKNGVDIARSIISDRPQLAGIEEFLSSDTDARFDALASMLETLGAHAVVASAPPNVSELTGISFRDNVMIVAPRDAEVVFVLASADIYSVHAQIVGRYHSLSAAIESLAGGRTLAVEEGWMTLRTALSLQDAGFDLCPASASLSKWREIHDHEDLAFAVIVAQASRFCIEGAIKSAEEGISRGEPVTEREIYRRYLDLIHDFRRQYAVPFAIRPYFTGLHASNRGIYPSCPVEFPITDETNSIRIDGGLTVSVDNVVLGASDVARTLAQAPEAEEAFETFMSIVRYEVIGSLRPGTICEDVHDTCVKAILSRQDRLTEIGLMPPGVDFAGAYGRRNIGHLMGKQESFVTEFRPGDKTVLHQGAIGAVEIQWPYEGYSIAAEDMWFLGPNGAWIISC